MADQLSKSPSEDGWECFRGLAGKEFVLPNISGPWLGVEFVFKKEGLDDIMEHILYPAAIFDDSDVADILIRPSFPIAGCFTSSEAGCLNSVGRRHSSVSLRDKHPHILSPSLVSICCFVPNPLTKPCCSIGPHVSVHGPELGGESSSEKSLFNLGVGFCCNLCKMPSDTNEALVWHMTHAVRPVVKEEPVEFGIHDSSRAKK